MMKNFRASMSFLTLLAAVVAVLSLLPATAGATVDDSNVVALSARDEAVNRGLAVVRGIFRRRRRNQETGSRAAARLQREEETTISSSSSLASLEMDAAARAAALLGDSLFWGGSAVSNSRRHSNEDNGRYLQSDACVDDTEALYETNPDVQTAVASMEGNLANSGEDYCEISVTGATCTYDFVQFGSELVQTACDAGT